MRGIRITGWMFVVLLPAACTGDVNEALVAAAAEGDAAAVQALLDKGAEINAKTEEGGIALIVASAGGHTATVEALIKKGEG